MLYTLLSVLLLLFIFLYMLITANFDKWSKLGVPHVPGRFPSGSFPFVVRWRNFAINVEQACKEFKDERFFGTFMFGKPLLVVNDVELIKAIKVKDFHYFTDSHDENYSKIMRSGGDLDALFNHNISSAKGEEWKDLRSTFSPIFTSAKMKQMVKYMEEVSQKLVVEMGKRAESSEEFELKDLTGRFSLDALASCAFGIDFNSHCTEKNAAFVENVANIFKNDLKTGFGNAFKLIPGVVQMFKFFNFNVQHPKEVKFFKDIVLQTLQSRRKSGDRRNDLVDMMLDCMKEKEQMEDENGEKPDQYQEDMQLVHKRKRKITDEDIISNLMIFMMVGYDTTGMTLAYALYELSLNPEAQEKLQQEVDQVWQDAGGKMPGYNSVQELPYLEMVLMETLRLHTPAPNTLRSCTAPYTIPGTNITLQKNDTIVCIASFLHKDPRHWTKPTSFFPEHFNQKEKSNRSPHAFQGFGQGPCANLG